MSLLSVSALGSSVTIDFFDVLSSNEMPAKTACGLLNANLEPFHQKKMVLLMSRFW